MDQQSKPTQPPAPTAAPRKGINVTDRAKNILLTPKTEWEIIQKEPFSTATILTNYVLPMLLLGAFASFIGWGFVGTHGMKLGAGGGAVRGIIFIVFTAVLVYGMAAAIDVLAPSFASEKNWAKSFQLAAYSLTAAYIGALFWLFPAVWILVLLCSLYSLYALYTGIPVLKKTAPDKQLPYFAVVLIITVVVAILLSLLMTEIAKSFQPNPYRNLYRQFNF